MAGRADIMAGRAFVSLYVKNSAFMRGLRQAKQQLAEFGADIQALGRQMVVASAAMLVPLAMASKTFADFDDGMRAVGAVSNSTAEELAMLTEQAKELGRTTSFTAIEVASLMSELGRAGFKPDQVDAMTGSVLALARATGTDATISSGIMAASIRQFSLGAGDASRVADGLTAAANKSFNTVEQLGEALSYAGPVAADFNVSLEDTLAILGGLGNVGIQGSNAGTAVRRLLTLSGAEAENMKRIFGVTFRDAAGNARPLVDVLSEVNDATADLGTADRAKKFNEAFGLLGITGASAIARSTGDIRQLSDEIKAAGGVAEETAAKMDAGLGGAFRIIMSAAEGLKIAIGEALQAPLTEIVKAGTEVLGVLTKLAEENKELIVSFAKWGVAIGAAGVALLAIGLSASFASLVLGGLLSVITGITFAFGALIGIASTFFAVMTSPVTLVVVAIAGITAAILQASGAIDSMVTNGIQMFDRLRSTVSDAFSGIRDAIGAGDLELAGQIAMTGLRLAFTQGMQAIAELVEGTMGQTVGAFISQIAGGDFAGAWNTVVLGMTAVWESFSNGLVETFVGVGTSIIDTWRKTVDEMANYILQEAAKGGFFGSLFEKFSGVNVKEELERQARIEADAEEAGMSDGPDPIFDDVRNGTFSDPATRAAADKAQAALAEMLSRSQARESAAAAELAAATEGGAGRGSDEVRRLEMKLSDLRMQADLLRRAADEEPMAGTGAVDGKGAGGGSGAAGSVGGRVSVATTSAAAAIALGQGGGGESAMVREQRETKSAIKKASELARIDANLQLNQLSQLGLHHA